MAFYTATHTNKKAAANHTAKIKRRGGLVQRKNRNGAIELSYYFPAS